MKKFLFVFLSLLVLFVTGCGNDMATPTSKVEEFLGKYQSMDSDVLTQLDKKNFLEIDLEKIIALEKQFSFLNKKIWQDFFSEKELPTQEMIAAVFGCSKSNASKMMSRFYERLKKSILK